MTPTPLSIRIVVWLWLITALYAGQQGWLRALPAPALVGMIGLLTAAVLAAHAKLAGLRRWVEALDLRALVLLHTTRFVGVYFLLLHQRGELPGAFAVPAGWGDIVVATGALLVSFLPLSPVNRHHALSTWNVLGLIDLLLVVSTAARLELAQPGAMHALRHLPLSLLPTFLVPLLLATHVMIFQRLRREPAADAA